jgi:hypothetical protein
MKKKYEIVVHGVDNSQYFLGPTPTDRSRSVIGVGYNAKEAYNDAVDQIYNSYEQAEKLHLPTRPRGVSKKMKVSSRDLRANDDLHFYVQVSYDT